MNKKLITLFISLLVPSALGATPSESLDKYKAAAQAGDFEAAWEYVAKFDGLPDEAAEYLRGKVKRFVDLTSVGWDFDIIEEKIEGDCAVVVINESKKEGREAFDIDPAYLIKQGGEWRVFPDITDWEIAEQVAEDRVDGFKRLEEWFKVRKEELKEERRLGMAEPSIREHPERKDVTGVDSEDKEMLAAQEKARDTLMTFIKALQSREEEKRYLLKVRLEEGDEVEHVWLEPVKWNDPGLLGILAVDPVAIRKHKRGDVIAPLPSEIFDWVILKPDGTKEGGFTADVIEKRKKEAEARE